MVPKVPGAREMYIIRKHHIKESQEVSLFPTCDKAARNRQDDITQNKNNKKDQQKKQCLGMVSKKKYSRA